MSDSDLSAPGAEAFAQQDGAMTTGPGESLAREMEQKPMADLKIKVFKGDDSQPETTVTVPGAVLKLASRLIPKLAMDALQKEGIDVGELIKLAQNPDARGIILEVAEHRKHERIVIALE